MLHSSGYTAHPFLLFLGKYPTKMHIVASKDMYKDVHSNIIHYRPKLKQSIMSINKHLGMMEYYTTVKINKLLLHTTAWVSLTDVVFCPRRYKSTV